MFQGDLDDCALLAHLAALAAVRPELLSAAMREGPDGRVAVALHRNGAADPTWVEVDREVPTVEGRLVFAGEGPPAFIQTGARGPAEANTRPVWPVLVEKAFAELHGGYAGLDKELITLPQELTGWHLFTVWTPRKPASTSLAILRRALDERWPVTLGNADPEAAKPRGLRPAHAYAVVGTSTRDGVWVVRLRNPTGESRPPLARAGDPPGEVQLPAAEAVAVFRFLATVAPDTTGLQALFDGRADPETRR